MSAWEGKKRASVTDIPAEDTPAEDIPAADIPLAAPADRDDSCGRGESTAEGAAPPDRTELEVLYDDCSEVLAAIVEDEGIAAPGAAVFLRQAVEAVGLARDGFPGLTGPYVIELTHWARMGAEFRAKFMGFDTHAVVRNHFIDAMERLAPTLPAAERAS